MKKEKAVIKEVEVERERESEREREREREREKEKERERERERFIRNNPHNGVVSLFLSHSHQQVFFSLLSFFFKQFLLEIVFSIVF